MILKWAISCELNHIEFYFALLKAKEAVKNFYEKYPRAKEKLLTEEQRKAKDSKEQEIRTKDPDSLYSPFNPRHPGYKEYSDVLRSGLGTTMQARRALPSIELVQLMQLLVTKGVISYQEYTRLTQPQSSSGS